VILGQKLTLNHPCLVNEEEKTRILVTTHKRRGEREHVLHVNSITFNFVFVKEPSFPTKTFTYSHEIKCKYIQFSLSFFP